MPYAVRVQMGSERGKLYPLFDNREITVGRSPTNNISIRDENISRVHCQIVVSDGTVILTDLQSTNGTFLNNERVMDCMLKVHDIIRVGATLLELEEVDEPGQTDTDTKVME